MSTKTKNIFEGMNFDYPPVSRERFVSFYEEYAKRCTAEELQNGIAASKGKGKHKDYEKIRYEFEAIIMSLNGGCRIAEIKQEKDPQTGNLTHTIELTY